MGMNSTGLECFYKTSLKPIISYACPTWYTFLAEKDETELERLQKTATKNIDERIPPLHLPDVNNFFYFLQLITTSLKYMFTQIHEKMYDKICIYFYESDVRDKING